MKKLILFFLPLCLLLAAGCSPAAEPTDGEGASQTASAEPVLFPDFVLTPSSETEGDSILCDETGYTILASGSYTLSGSMQGRVLVDADGPVELILDGVTLTGSCPLCVESVYPVTVTLAAGSDNLLSDGVQTVDEDAPAVLASDAPLTIGGEGHLSVLAGADNGLNCTRGLTVTGGRLDVTAAHHAIRCKGALCVEGGALTLDAGGDGFAVVDGRLEDASFTVSDGTLTVNAAGRAVDSDGLVLLSAGEGSLTAAGDGVHGLDVLVLGGGWTVSSGDEALQADGNLTVTGGALSVDTCVKALRAEKLLSVLDGTLSLSSSGDCISSGGTLTVSGGLVNLSAGDDALRSAADIVLEGGTLVLGAVGDAACADGCVAVSGGELTAVAQGDGLQAGTDLTFSGGTLVLESGENGLCAASAVTVEAGSMTVCSAGDALQAGTELTIYGGTLDITAGDGGGSASSHAGDSFGFGPGGGWGGSASTAADVSCKGLKSDGNITISGGTIALNTEDDAIHCAALCSVTDGDVTICSSDDAIHADDWLYIRGGTINITDCFEGLEAFAVNVSGGDITIRAVNDGINANGSEWGESDFVSLSGQTNTYYCQTGGKIDLVVTGNSSNMGDGVDSNGSLYIYGGELLVSTFGTYMENGLDYGYGYFIINGGMVMAGGSSSMAEAPSSASTQCSAKVEAGTMPDNTLVTLLDMDGNELWSAVMTNTFTSLVISHPSMTVGNTYLLRLNDTEITLDFTDSTIFEYGSGGGGWGGGPGGGGGRPF